MGEAWWSLASLKTVRLDAADILRMKQALGDSIGVYTALSVGLASAGRRA